jgi:hypothetical protein
MRGSRSPYRIPIALVGLLLAGVGLGWSAAPADERVLAAVKMRLLSTDPGGPRDGAALEARAAELLAIDGGDLHVVGMRRDWFHEFASPRPSEFLVKVAWTGADGSARDACFRVQPGRLGADWALGPQSVSDCD